MFKEAGLVAFSIPFYAVLIGLELWLSNKTGRKAYTWRDTLSNVYLTSLNMGLDVVLRGLVFAILSFFFLNAWPVFKDINPWLYWFLLFIFEDFAFYWLHRIDHESRFFWAVHVTHHSSQHFNLSTGFRSSVFQPLYRFIYFIPLAALGFAPLDILLMYSITQIYGIIVHTEQVDKLGWLEYILVTPSHHRVHHASNVLYLDKNMGMALIIWDKLFGTFQAEMPEEPVRYGLHKDLTEAERGPVNLVFHEWRNILQDVKREDLNWSQRWRYVFAAPGWSHDGSRQTARELRAEWQQANKPHQGLDAEPKGLIKPQV